ncbi:MAG: YceH family protein [Thermoguttaceae bacterium]|nr:YceH family protein [Thermoguttaceae bacterium]MDW8037477.1 DUF480 domain-containing protein [Thermoguttaceae bacterium]
MSGASGEIINSAAPAHGRSEASAKPPQRWQPIGPVERRVLGVLVEKAKTTPDVYPLSLNAITTGANQKSNRDPIMQLEPEDVEAALERLRTLGAVGLVEGYGRVPKYRHYLYEWLGVDKVEAAVMAELLLRGPQTEGQLRAHTCRMEPIPDLPTLRQILASLKSKGLVVSLTPEGRGHVVAHALYLPEEMARLQTQYQRAAQTIWSESSEPSLPASEPAQRSILPASCPVPEAQPALNSFSSSSSQTVSLQAQLADLRQELAQLRQQMELLAQKSQQHEEVLEWLRKELGV